MKKNKYNYKRFALVLDADIPEDKKIIDWLEKHKGKRNGYSVQLRKALLRLMEEEDAS